MKTCYNRQCSPFEKGGQGDLKIFMYNQASQNPPLDAGTPFSKGGSLLTGDRLCGPY